MKHLRVFGLWVLSTVVLASCGTTPTTQPTATVGIDPVAAGVQLIQQDMALRLTQQFIENERLKAGAMMTATQQFLDVQATVVERSRQERAAAQAATATYQVFEVTRDAAYAQGTATAQAQGTQQAIAYQVATGTAQAQATENTVKATQETNRWNLQATAQAAQAESAKLAADRERMTNGVIAWGPWVGFGIALAAAIFFAQKYLHVRAFKPDERGDAPYLVIGGQQVIDLDGLPGALLDLKTQQAPLLTNPENTAQIKARDQFIDLNTRGLPNQFMERKPTAQMPMPGATARVEIAPYAEVQKLLAGAEEQLSGEEVQ
ncbi:MAG: hypothetical protein EHM81_04665 [Chloroflexi bacterium]|nr:MAG: hypothetical protein EHM81_04665 [Chloroflexota bacterium]